MHPIVPLLIAMARAAREISLPKFRTGLIRELKKDHSPVSAIDRAVEQRLRDFIPEAEKTLKATVGFIGEEFGTLNADAEFLFIVDPIDGTKPYLLGRGEWFTLIGLYHRTDGFVAGLCDQPAADIAHYAARGAGAFVLDRTNLGVATPLPALMPKALSESVLLSFDPYMLPLHHRSLYEKLRERCLYAVPGGDAGNYARVAEGAGQLVLDCVGGIYDLAALMPILTETGACLVGLNDDGSTFVPGLDFGARRTVLASASERLRDEVLKLL